MSTYNHPAKTRTQRLACAGLLVLLCLLSACKRDDSILGPPFITAPEGFAVLSFTSSIPAVDFTAEATTFDATFSHTVSWVMTVRGDESGALREYRGTSQQLSRTWEGRHDGVAFFKTGETVTATLSFMGTKLTSAIAVTVNEARDYTSYGTMPVGGDFEDPSLVNFDNGWMAFNLANQGRGSYIEDLNGNIVKPVQGDYYYYLRDVPAQDAQFIDGIRYDGDLLPEIPADPSNVWVNIYVYGTGRNNVQFNFEFKEDDFDSSNPGYSDTEDDAMVATIFPTHTGWRLYSFRYSSLNVSAAPQFGGSGNGIHEPDRIVSVQFGLLKTGDTQSQAEVYFDFPIITIGGPFDPTE